MKLAILTYAYLSNPQGIPSEWPAEVIEIDDLAEAPSENHVIMTRDEYVAYRAAHQANFNSWFASAYPADTLQPYINIINNAKAFGGNLITIAAAENIAMGIVGSGKTKLIADALRDVSYYLNSGSLYEAMNAIDAVVISEEMSPFITTNRLLVFKNKIRAYLGMPLLS